GSWESASEHPLNRRHSNHVWLAYKPKCDCTFQPAALSFRSRATMLRQALARPGETSLSTPSVISVVDDDASVRTSIDNLLRSRGYVVHMFESAGELLESPHLNETSC